MKLSQATARFFIPDCLPEADALPRTTHLGVGAHPDDLEFMTWHGIVSSYRSEDRWFAGVVVTDGAGSPRAGRYAGYTDEQMVATRLDEQRKAAAVGEYAALFCLGFTSAAIRAAMNPDLLEDLGQILAATRPEVVYTHNLFDAHDTHVSVALHVIQAIRALPEKARPEAVYGCEAWRSLDWLPEADRVSFDVSGSEHLAAALMGVYDSQISDGKRYDLAAQGRKRANATYRDARAVDQATAVELAMNLTALVHDPALDIHEYALGIVHRFADAVSLRLRRFLP